jgi:hypothetical protein
MVGEVFFSNSVAEIQILIPLSCFLFSSCCAIRLIMERGAEQTVTPAVFLKRSSLFQFSKDKKHMNAALHETPTIVYRAAWSM